MTPDGTLTVPEWLAAGGAPGEGPGDGSDPAG
jgi:hypothetical protein